LFLLSPSMEILGQYLTTGHNSFLPHYLQIIQNNPNIRCYTNYTTEKGIVKRPQSANRSTNRRMDLQTDRQTDRQTKSQLLAVLRGLGLGSLRFYRTFQRALCCVSRRLKLKVSCTFHVFIQYECNACAGCFIDTFSEKDVESLRCRIT